MAKYKGTLTATGATEPFGIDEGHIEISGTWTGTWTLQTDLGNGWGDETDEETGDVIEYTTNMRCAIDNGAKVPTRINWTRTDGTLVFAFVTPD